MAFKINSNVVKIESNFLVSKSIDVKISGNPILYKGTVYVPLRAFAELFGADVNYNKYTYTVLFNVTENQIKNSIFPRVGLTLDDSIIKSDSNIPPNPKKILTAKEIAKLMDRVGFVVAYDTDGQPYTSGSGFLIGNGMFITNYHVAEGSSGLMVKIDGEIYDTRGWYWLENAEVDIYGSILSTSYSSDGYTTGISPNQFLSMQAELPEIGDKIYAIGSPLGLENSISDGIVSGIRTIDGVTMIQHTADIDSGSSGGALLNEYGEVIGITSSGYKGSNLEFAIPIKYVQDELSK
ncbi:trypsin-like peptidase domain-containing protein [Paenibacillus sp. CMAA1364]